MWRWLVGLAILLGSLPALAQGPATEPVSGYCDLGGSKAQVSGLGSTNYQQGSIPGCTITVYQHGTLTLATLFADDAGTPLSNPFTAVVAASPNAGFYIFWAATNAGYDVVASGGTAPVTYPAPQTIKEIFLGGGGGGGGGTCPSGNLYDIQIDDPLGTCGSDVGIGQIVPGTHTLYENILNANQQVDVSDATNSGLICQGHSTGSSVDSAYCTEPSTTFSPTPTGGYGLFPPDNAPSALHQAIRVSSLTPTNVVTKYGTLPFYPTEFSTTGAGVSLEYLYPLDFTNAPSPTTSSDLVRTLFPQGVSTALMGPPPGSVPGPFVYQSRVCTGTGTTASCQFLGPSKPGHTYTVGVVSRGASTVGNPTDTAGNTFTALHGPGATFVVAYAPNIVGATPSTPINTISETLDTSVIWIEIIQEIGDVPTTSPVETSASQIGGCSGTTLSFAPVTTTATDLIVGYNMVSSTASGSAIYSASSPYSIDQQLSMDTGGLTPLLSAVTMDGIVGAGTITPTIQSTNCVGETVTIAFKDGGLTDWADPRFRYPTQADWVQQGIWPTLTASQSIVSDGTFLHALTFGSGLTFNSSTNTLSVGGGSGAVTSFSGDGSFATNSASTGAVTLTLNTAAAHKWWGNNTGSTAAPGYQTIGNSDLPGTGSTTVNGQTCTLGSTCTVTAAPPSGSVYKWRSCTGIGLGDGVNAITAATYPVLGCVNNSGATLTITGIHCYTDNNGSSTLDVKNNAGTSLLTGAITCTNTKTSGGAAGTLSGTTTIVTTDAFNFTFISDGTSKVTTWTVDTTLP